VFVLALCVLGWCLVFGLVWFVFCFCFWPADGALSKPFRKTPQNTNTTQTPPPAHTLTHTPKYHETQQINAAEGDAEAITRRAAATATGLASVARALADNARGADAAQLAVAEAYVDAFSKVARESSVVLLPANAGDPAAMVAQAMSAFRALGGGGAGGPGAAALGAGGGGKSGA